MPIRVPIGNVGDQEKVLDAALDRGLADAESGRVYAADDVFDGLKARYADLIDKRVEEGDRSN